MSAPDGIAQSPGRYRKITAVGIAGFILVVAVWELSWQYADFAGRGAVGQDWAYYVTIARRWLDTGVLYGDRQLAGVPYHTLDLVDNLYPPPAILLLAPFALLPWWLSAAVWWAVPAGVLGLVTWRYRPGAWTWPVLAFCLAWPRTQGHSLAGNSDLWAMAFVGGGLLWGWPGALNVFKISYGPVFLAGGRRRSWWIALAACGIASVAFWGYWGQYLVAATHWDASPLRALPGLPLVLMPAVAWAGRTRDPCVVRR